MKLSDCSAYARSDRDCSLSSTGEKRAVNLTSEVPTAPSTTTTPLHHTAAPPTIAKLRAIFRDPAVESQKIATNLIVCSKYRAFCTEQTKSPQLDKPTRHFFYLPRICQRNIKRKVEFNARDHSKAFRAGFALFRPRITLIVLC